LRPCRSRFTEIAKNAPDRQLLSEQRTALSHHFRREMWRCSHCGGSCAAGASYGDLDFPHIKQQRKKKRSEKYSFENFCSAKVL
jgi:ribosomal protein L37AE/L43A